MKVLLASFALCLGPATALHAQEDGSGAQAPQGPDAAAQEVPDAVEWSREFAKHWPTAEYAILRKGREIGTYVQNNKITKLRGRELVEFSDVVSTPGSDGYRAQSTHTLAAGLPTRTLQASTEVDGIKLAFTGGRMVGQALMKRQVDLEAPRRFVTDVTLLRGVPRIPAVKGAEAVIAYVDLEALPSPECVSKGTLRCQGQHEIELHGETVTAWKYRWEPEGNRPTFFWYGDKGELLRREHRKEIWELKKGK